MSLYAQIKELRQKRKDILDAAGAILTKAFKDTKKAPVGEPLGEFNKRHAEGDEIQALVLLLEKQLDAENDLNRITDRRSAGREDDNGQETRELNPKDKEQRATLVKLAFRQWMAHGEQGLNVEQRQLLAHQRYVPNPSDPEERALSALAGNVGAYTIPAGFQYTLEVALKAYGGMLENAGTIDTDQGNLLPWPTINDTANAGEVIAENTAVAGASGGAAEQDPVYGVMNLNAYMHDSGFVLVPIQLLQDSAFDVETYMTELLKIRLGRKLNNKMTVGTGANEITGIQTAAAVGATAASNSAIAYNDLLNLEHSVDPLYRPGAKFMFHDTILKLIKQLTDSNGRPLFIAGGVSEGPQKKYPDQIDGHDFVINQDMPSAIASTVKTVVFGELSKYKLRRVKSIQMIQARERFIDKLQYGYLVFIRADGNLLDAGTNPVKQLKH